MSDAGEIREEVAAIRRELLDMVTRLRTMAHDQAGLKAVVTLSLDHLDAVDERLRKL
jgi:hypothetical protein